MVAHTHAGAQTHQTVGDLALCEVRAGDPQGLAGHVDEHPLEDGQGRSGSDGPTRPAQHIGEIISLSSDTHR